MHNSVNFPDFHRGTVWWLAGTAMVVLIVAGWYAGSVLLGDHAIAESSSLGGNEEPESRQVENPHRIAQENIGEESNADVQANVLDLLLACSEDSEDLSEECMKILDARLLPKPLSEESHGWIEFPNALTYASIFKDPVGDRERVFAVLERPECRLEEGKRFRLDLKESCDAVAIARFSEFLGFCGFVGEPTSFEEFSYAFRFTFADLDRYEFPERLGSEDSSELEVLARSGLELRWKSKKCKERFDPSILLDSTRDAQQVASLQEMSRRWSIGSSAHVDVYTWNWTHVRVLQSLANRLGAEEASSWTIAPFLPIVDTDWHPLVLKNRPWLVPWVQHVRTTRPWLVPWKKLMRFPDRRQRTLIGIDLVLGLQSVGAKFDWNHLVDLICSRNAKDSSTCQEVFDEIKQSTDWPEVGKLQVLDEFETRAIELGLYD